MKQYILPFIMLVLISACGASKNYLERSDANQALVDAAKRLIKNPDDKKALEAVPLLYKETKNESLSKITAYKNSTDIKKWDKIIGAYNDLQEGYNAILGSTAAFKLVNPQNFSVELLEAKQSAADDYYNAGEILRNRADRESAKKAYSYFKRSNDYLPGFKDSKSQMEMAFEDAVVNVVVNPVEDNSFFFNTGWGNSGYNYSNEYFQRNLVRDLQNENTYNRYPARFYSDWEARRNNVQPDWIVFLRLRDMSVPYPQSYNYSRKASTRIKTGTDTSGKDVFQTVYANVNITRSSFTARATMDVTIKDPSKNKNISYRTFSDDYRWQEETGNYSGDSRALSSRDWAVINNRNTRSPQREDILNELYKGIYPQVKDNITYSVDW